jgi:hypothetical protein
LQRGWSCTRVPNQKSMQLHGPNSPDGQDICSYTFFTPCLVILPYSGAYIAHFSCCRSGHFIDHRAVRCRLVVLLFLVLEDLGDTWLLYSLVSRTSSYIVLLLPCILLVHLCAVQLHESMFLCRTVQNLAKSWVYMHLQSVQRPCSLGSNCKWWVMLRNLTRGNHGHDTADRTARLIVWNVQKARRLCQLQSPRSPANDFCARCILD